MLVWGMMGRVLRRRADVGKDNYDGKGKGKRVRKGQGQGSESGTTSVRFRSRTDESHSLRPTSAHEFDAARVPLASSADGLEQAQTQRGVFDDVEAPCCSLVAVWGVGSR